MRAYTSVLSARFRTLLQYRAAALAGFGTQLFWGFIRIMIFDAFYRSSTAPPPLSFDQMVTYIWLGQAMFALLPWRGDADVQGMIRSGTVAYEMLRPLDLYALWYSRAIAGRLAPTLLRSIPLFVVAGLFFGLKAPPSGSAAAGWVAAMAGALLLSAAFSNLITVSLLWTLSGEGAWVLGSALLPLLSGLIVPLPFFPAWARPVLEALPFRGLVDVPFRVYLGDIPPARLAAVLAHQLAWTGAFVLLGRWLLARGTRRLVVQGG
jgi:ABC-2 type transport system permease protein